MDIEHNSRQEFFRDPYGAVTFNTEVRFRLTVHGAGIPRSVKLVYKRDGGEDKYVDMPYVFSVFESSVYERSVKMPDEAGLVWYYFEIATDLGIVYYGNNPENLGGNG